MTEQPVPTIGARCKTIITFNVLDAPRILINDSEVLYPTKVEAIDYGDRARISLIGQTQNGYMRSKYYKLYGDKYTYPMPPKWLMQLVRRAGYQGECEGVDHSDQNMQR